jgi:hypothetical protein
MMRSLHESLQRLDRWVEQENFSGWEPHDALNSSFVRGLTFGCRPLGILWLQLIKKCPVNLRPVLGVPKGINPKAMGLFLATYWRKFLMTGDFNYIERVQEFAGWLEANSSPGYSGKCWGYNFDWPNRNFFAPAGTPTIVNTAFNAMAFLDLVTLRGAHERDIVRNIPALAVAQSACEFILHDLNQFKPGPGELCFSYSPLDKRWVHNANLLGACLLAQVAAQTGERRLKDAALAAARFSARRQHADGSWDYGENAGDGWVDNFHTGFVLVSLRRISRALETDEFLKNIDKGYSFWRTKMFLRDGIPKYYAQKTYPLDAHCVAQAILTFLEFGETDPDAFAAADALALWAIQHLQDASAGFFHYQIHKFYRIRIPYIRWSQAWMQRALTELLYVNRLSLQPLSTL